MASGNPNNAGPGRPGPFSSWPRVAAAFTLAPLILSLLPGLVHQTQIVTLLDHTDFWQPFFYLSLAVGTYLQFALPSALFLGLPLHLYFVRRGRLRWWHYPLGGVTVALVASVLAALLDPWRGTFGMVLFSPLYGSALGICVWWVLVWPLRRLVVIASCLLLWPVALGLLQGRLGPIPGDRYARTVVQITFADEHLNIPRNFIHSTWHDDRQGFLSVQLGFTLPDLEPMTSEIAARIIPPRSLKVPYQYPDPQHYLKVSLRDLRRDVHRTSSEQRPDRPVLKATSPDSECGERSHQLTSGCLRHLEIAGNLWAVYALEKGRSPLSPQLDRRIQSIIASFVVHNE